MWATILKVLVAILGFFRGGKGTRITVEARSEASIEKEQNESEQLHEKLKKKRAELVTLTVDAAVARARGKPDADELDGKLRTLKEEYDALAAGVQHRE